MERQIFTKQDERGMKEGLYVVGTGIKREHVTWEAEQLLSQAEKVFYVTTNKMTEELIKTLNVSAESLRG